MTAENTVSLKIYLKDGKNNIEVRRFEVDHGVITNYDYIRERLQIAIPAIRDKVFKLLWEDSEGDEVTISSDEELMIALSSLKSNVFKFIVRLQGSANDADNDTFININIPTMHDIFSHVSSFTNSCPLFTGMQGDINCSTCKKPINGTRYKCLECEQYCQCSECENKNLHSEHVMLRIMKNPTMQTLIPKCMQIFKNHLVRGATRCSGINNLFRERMSHCPAMNRDSCHAEKEKSSDKEKCGSRHHRKFRKHGHCDKNSSESKTSNQNDDSTPMQTECPFNEQMLGNLGNWGNLRNVVEAFLGAYKDVIQPTKGGENTSEPNAEASTSSATTSAAAAAATTTTAAPIKTIDLDGPPMPTAPEDGRMEDESATGTSEIQKDPKIKMALELLSEMGFTNDNQWLSRLLEHFNGDIAKTLDHLTLGK